MCVGSGVYVIRPYSKSEVGNNPVRTNKLFKFRIFKKIWKELNVSKFTEQIILFQEKYKICSH